MKSARREPDDATRQDDDSDIPVAPPPKKPRYFLAPTSSVRPVGVRLNIDLLNMSDIDKELLTLILDISATANNFFLSHEKTYSLTSLQSRLSLAQQQAISQYNCFSLSHSLLRRKSEGRPDEYVWQVLNQEIFRHEEEDKDTKILLMIVWKSEYVIVNDDITGVTLKQKAADKCHTVKFRFQMKAKSEVTPWQEYQVGQFLPQLHIKEPQRLSIDGKEVKVSVSRYFSGRTLDDILFMDDVLNQLCELSYSSDYLLSLIIELLHAPHWQMHIYNVVHRDIKGANIVVDDTVSPPKVSLIDVDLSLGPQASLMTETNLIGSPMYMSPEAFKCQKQSPKSDYYSLHWFIFYLLGGCVANPEDLSEAMKLAFYHRLDGLFSRPHDFTVTEQNKMRGALVQLSRADEHKRSAYEEAVAVFESIELDRTLQKTDVSLNFAIRIASACGVALRKALSQLALSHIRIAHAPHAELMQLINTHLLPVQDSPYAMYEFVRKSRVQWFENVDSKTMLLSRLDRLISYYQQQIIRLNAQQQEIGVLLRQPQSADNAAKLQQIDNYITRFITRFNRYTFTIDNMVMFIQKLEKRIAIAELVLSPLRFQGISAPGSGTLFARQSEQQPTAISISTISPSHYE